MDDTKRTTNGKFPDIRRVGSLSTNKLQPRPQGLLGTIGWTSFAHKERPPYDKRANPNLASVTIIWRY